MSPFTYDPTADAGIVRLLITDTDVANPDNQIFEDAEIDAFLTLEGSVVKRAAARALDVIATREVLVQKVIKIMDLTTDGAKVADALRALAKALRDEAAEDLLAAGGLFDWAEMVVDDFSARERLLKQAQRGLI